VGTSFCVGVALDGGTALGNPRQAVRTGVCEAHLRPVSLVEGALTLRRLPKRRAGPVVSSSYGSRVSAWAGPRQLRPQISPGIG
jgi:hypothetical protein